MKVEHCEQGSEEWFDLHRGRATASDFDKIITPKQMKPSASIDDLICQKIGELATLGSIMPTSYISPAMQNGIALEPEARRWYEMERDVEVQQVGICITDDGRFGASPDALIPDNKGALELKCPQPKTHISYLLDGGLPNQYRCQVHGELIVCEVDWVDFVSYCPGLDPFMIRVTPDSFTDALRECLEEYHRRFTAALAKIRLPQRENP